MKQILIPTFLLTCFIFTACNKAHENHQADSGSYYTCPMHPSVYSKTPGSCPVCNMSLIRMEKKNSEHAGHQGNFVTIDKQKQELAGIKTDTMRFRNILSEHTLPGTVAIDEEQVKTISSRIDGRIDTLFVKNTGDFLQKGSPLYSIYSEPLQANKKEYLALFEKSRSPDAPLPLLSEFLSAAKNKLLLWGLMEKQISDLETSGDTSPLITFFSPATGYVVEVNIVEGMYVEEGSPLLKITSLDAVWVEAQVFSNEIANLAKSRSFQVYSESSPGELYAGTLVYNNPVIEEGKRIHLLKIRVDNAKGKLIPGMFVFVIPKKPSPQVLAAPRSAVLAGKMKAAWVLVHDNTFEQRMVETGTEDSYWIEITSGLKEGEVIVTEGTYLINSEFILKSGAGQSHEH